MKPSELINSQRNEICRLAVLNHVRHPRVFGSVLHGMRNRLAHGHFEIGLDVVWETVKPSLPELGRQLRQIRESS